MEEEAKELMKITSQGLSNLGISENEINTRAKSICIEIVEHFIGKMVEGSSVWLYHRELIKAINDI